MAGDGEVGWGAVIWKVRFSFFGEEITEGKRCNCSLCSRKGAIMSAKCKTCGIFPYFGNDEYGFRVNLGCVEQIDAMSLPISIIDGKSLAVSGNPGPWPGQNNQ
jgi:hypothetical protein